MQPCSWGQDDDSWTWVEGLRKSKAADHETVASLWSLLLRVARREANRRAALLGFSGPELNDLAHQAADDAFMAILGKIDDFRGESRFSTWAYKFAIFEVSMKMGRHFWRNRLATLDDAGWENLADRIAPAPEQQFELRELVGALRRAVEEDLTERQRKVFIAIVLNEVPPDAVADELGSNRNAIYKTLFDARRRLRASLGRLGYKLDGTRQLLDRDPAGQEG